MRRSLGIVVMALAVGLGLAGCSDDGASTQEETSGSGSGSGSGSASGSGSGSASGSGSGVPAGVAQQYATVEEEIQAEGGEQASGPWRVAYIVEPAEPWFVAEGDSQTFRQPAEGETHHIEIIPFEADTGRIVPEVPIRLEVLDEGGQVVDEQDLNFYYAEFFHYANNFSVPDAGTYSLRATLQPPTFLRHGEESESPALADGATVTFDGVELQPAS